MNKKLLCTIVLMNSVVLFSNNSYGTRIGEELKDASIKIYPKSFSDGEDSQNIRNLIVLGNPEVKFLEFDTSDRKFYVSHKDDQKTEIDKTMIRGFNWNVDSEKIEKYIQNTTFTLKNLSNDDYVIDISYPLNGGGGFFSKSQKSADYHKGFNAGYLEIEDENSNINLLNADYIEGKEDGKKQRKSIKKLDNIQNKLKYYGIPTAVAIFVAYKYFHGDFKCLK